MGAKRAGHQTISRHIWIDRELVGHYILLLLLHLYLVGIDHSGLERQQNAIKFCQRVSRLTTQQSKVKCIEEMFSFRLMRIFFPASKKKFSKQTC
jgi:hypothetical protein